MATPGHRLARIAIVGRPNVGKSTLFNALRDRNDGARRAQIVSPIARTTRDLREASGRLGELKFKVLDTAGYENRDDTTQVKQSGSFEGMSHAMAARTIDAIKMADAVVMLLDGQSGVTGMDYEVADWLRRSVPSTTRRIACFNKCENHQDADADEERDASAFGSKGEEVLRISAVHGDGMPSFLETLRRVVPVIPPPESEAFLEEDIELPKEIRVALVGRANVGKSTLLNALARDEISLAAAIPGVTRDAVEVLLDFEGRRVCLVDTAGLRRSQVCDAVDTDSIAATRRELRNCDVAILCIDCSEPLQREDRRLATAAQQADAIVVLANKLDAAPGTAQEVADRVRGDLFRTHFSGHAVVAASALEGPARARRALHFAIAAHDANHKRLPTGKLNSWLDDWLAGPHGEDVTGIRYMSQIGINPPSFGLWGRGLKAKLPKEKLNVIEDAIRRDFDFKGARIRLVFRGDSGLIKDQTKARKFGSVARPFTKKFGQTRMVRLGKNRNKNRDLQKGFGVPVKRGGKFLRSNDTTITTRDENSKDRSTLN